MVRTYFVLALAWVAVAAAQTGNAPEQSPEQLVRSIVEQVKASKSAQAKADEEGQSEEKRAESREKHERLLNEASDALMFVARKLPWHPAAVDALAWVLLEGSRRGDEIAEAFDLLTADHVSPSLQQVNHLSDDRIAGLCLGLLERHPLGEVTGFYRTVMAKTENRRGRAIAIYTLARRSREASRQIREGLGKPPENRLGEVHYSKAEAKRLAAEADALFGQLADEYGDVTLGPETLGDLARANLAATTLEVGRPAPEVEGVDAEGHSFKLSDYRGKVVVLSFWAGWCAPCLELIPEERALVERMKGRPFVLLGVNADHTMQGFRKANDEHQVQWPSWWDGPNALISTRWNVTRWPSLFVIDRDGVLRSERLSFRDVQARKLDLLVERLLKED